MYIMHAYQRGVPLPYRGFQQEEFIDKFMSKQSFYRIILKDLFSSASISRSGISEGKSRVFIYKRRFGLPVR